MSSRATDKQADKRRHHQSSRSKSSSKSQSANKTSPKTERVEDGRRRPPRPRYSGRAIRIRWTKRAWTSHKFPLGLTLAIFLTLVSLSCIIGGAAAGATVFWIIGLIVATGTVGAWIFPVKFIYGRHFDTNRFKWRSDNSLIDEIVIAPATGSVIVQPFDSAKRKVPMSEFTTIKYTVIRKAEEVVSAEISLIHPCIEDDHPLSAKKDFYESNSIEIVPRIKNNTFDVNDGPIWLTRCKKGSEETVSIVMKEAKEIHKKSIQTQANSDSSSPPRRVSSTSTSKSAEEVVDMKEVSSDEANVHENEVEEWIIPVENEQDEPSPHVALLAKK